MIRRVLLGVLGGWLLSVRLSSMSVPHHHQRPILRAKGCILRRVFPMVRNRRRRCRRGAGVLRYLRIISPQLWLLSTSVVC